MLHLLVTPQRMSKQEGKEWLPDGLGWLWQWTTASQAQLAVAAGERSLSATIAPQMPSRCEDVSSLSTPTVAAEVE